MFKRMKDHNRSLKPILIAGTIIVVCCLFVCFIHIFDVTNRYWKQVDNGLSIQINDIITEAENKLEKNLKDVISVSEFISEMEKDSSDIYEILHQYKNFDGFQELYFILEDGTTYNSIEKSNKVQSREKMEFIHVICALFCVCSPWSFQNEYC